MRRRKYQRMEFKARPHPSGRPIAERNYTELPFRRHVPDEPLTPGLRPGRERSQAIGFMARLVSDEDE